MTLKTIVIIPARYGSSRMAGKVLARQTGKYLVEHTYQRALQAKKIQKVLIATDDPRVMRACAEFGAPCVMTSPEHPSGTDRIAEAAADVTCDIVINLQADEPEIDPAYIDRLAGLLENQPDVPMATLLAPFDDPQDVLNPNIVKCVVDASGRALYFSRAAVPFDRAAGGVGPLATYRRHLGIYAYRKEFLMTFTRLPAGRLEQIEKLEQLRALENGFPILTDTVEKAWDGIDTPEQYAAFVARYKNDQARR